MASYKVLTGLNYPPDNRAEIGDVVDDIPSKSIKWLVEIGAIEKVDGKPSKASKVDPVVEEPVVEESAVEETVVEETYSWVDATTDKEAKS